VGETPARRIVESRNDDGLVSSHDDLAGVPGIGPKTIDAIRPYLLPITEPGVRHGHCETLGDARCSSSEIDGRLFLVFVGVDDREDAGADAVRKCWPRVDHAAQLGELLKKLRQAERQVFRAVVASRRLN
tara:strand:- start:346 stop:735 length:390 start_codon:yes stop_codon:yes gene_type:complete